MERGKSLHDTCQSDGNKPGILLLDLFVHDLFHSPICGSGERETQRERENTTQTPKSGLL